jgi:hypothetical protein
MDRDKLAQLVTTAWHCALTNDKAGASNALAAIGDSGDPFDMYGACCGWAEIGKAALKKIYGDRAANVADGDMWVIEELQPGAMAADPPKAFAARFLIAYCNDDRETAPALYRAALEAGDEQYIDSMCALLVDVAGISRLALKDGK